MAGDKLTVRKGLKGAEDAILTCTLCGYCKESCPFFNLLGWDRNTSRGRILLSYALLHGKVAPDEKAVSAIFRCTLCRRCELDCSSKLKILEILEAVRRDIRQSGKLHPYHAAILEKIEKSGNIFGDATPSTEMHDEKPGKSNVAFFAGCVGNYAARKPAQAARKLLKRLGIEHTIIDEVCCGQPNNLLGDDFVRVAKKNLDTLKKLGVKELVLSCDGCYKMFKEQYPKVLKSDIKVKHILEVLADNLDKLPSPVDKPTITYHDSCDLGRHLKMYDLPRKVLSKFANIKEMAATREKALCCGTGGGARIAFGPDADAIAVMRLGQAEGVADTMVTTCPACAHSMEVAGKKAKKKVHPTTVAQFVLEAVEKAR